MFSANWEKRKQNSLLPSLRKQPLSWSGKLRGLKLQNWSLAEEILRDVKLAYVNRNLRVMYNPRGIHSISASPPAARTVNARHTSALYHKQPLGKTLRQITQGNFVVWLHPEKEETKRERQTADSQAVSSMLRSNSPFCHSWVWESWGWHREVTDTLPSLLAETDKAAGRLKRTLVWAQRYYLRLSERRCPGFSLKCLNFSA